MLFIQGVFDIALTSLQQNKFQLEVHTRTSHARFLSEIKMQAKKVE